MSASIIHTMDDDGFPNFDNAYTGASPATPNPASWNPALRPDSEAVQPVDEPAGGDDDDFFDRYQEPTPRKKRLDLPIEDDGSEQAAAESTTDIESPTNHHNLSAAEANTPVSHDEDAAVFGPDETVEEQARDLEEHMPEVAIESIPASAEPVDKAGQTEEAVQEECHRPEEHYDYQGEVTEMENAIDESAEAPLMEDEEPTPVLGVVSRAPTFEPQQNGFEDDLQAGQDTSEATKSPPAMIERSFTTNFTEPPQRDAQQSTLEQEQTVDEDWPAAGDDKTFGEILESQQMPQRESPRDEELHTDPPTQSSEPEVQEQPTNADLEDWPTSAEDKSFDTLLGEQSQPVPEDAFPSADTDKSVDGDQAVNEQWPEVEGDDAFGELLGSQPKKSNEAEGLAIANARTAAGLETNTQPAEEDLSAAFAAALDDDEILDDNELDPALLFGDDDDQLLDDDDDFLGGSHDEPQTQAQQSSYARSSYTPKTVH